MLLRHRRLSTDPDISHCRPGFIWTELLPAFMNLLPESDLILAVIVSATDEQLQTVSSIAKHKGGNNLRRHQAFYPCAYSRLPSGGSAAAIMGQWRLYFSVLPLIWSHTGTLLHSGLANVFNVCQETKATKRRGTAVCLLSPMQFVPVELTLFLSSLLLFPFSTIQVKTFEPVRLLI